MITTAWKRIEKSRCSLRRATRQSQKASRAGISETVRKGLELLVANDAYDRLLKMRGKVKFSIDLNELRDDRR